MGICTNQQTAPMDEKISIKSFSDIPEVLVKSANYEIKQFSNIHSEKPIYILKNKTLGSFLLLNEYDYFIWESIDGINTISDIYLKFLAKYEKLPYEYIFKFIQKICYANLIVNYKCENIEGKKSILEIKVPIPFFSRFMFFCYQIFGRFLYNWVFLVVYGLIVSAGILTFFTTLNQDINLSGMSSYLYAFLACIVPVVIHEVAHAFTCLHYKRTIYDSGFMFYMFMPAFYVNTSDIWMEDRKKRFMVSLAGPMSDVFMGSLFALVYAYYIQSPYIYLISCMSFARGLFNLNPLLKWDGYYCLMDILDIYNLSSLSKNFIFKIYPQRIHKSKTFALSQKEMLLLIYGVFSQLFFIYFISVLIANTSGMFVNIYYGKPVTFTASLIISIILLATLLLNLLKYFIEKMMVFWKIILKKAVETVAKAFKILKIVIFF